MTRRNCPTRDNPLLTRLARADLSEITIRKASSDSDFETVARLREVGFSRVNRKLSVVGNPALWLDGLDREPGVLCLISYNSAGQPMATMRVQDGRVSVPELAKFVPLDRLLLPQQMPAAQFARLSVTKGPQSACAMLGLFKSAWKWCLKQGIRSIVLGTPPWSRHIYDFLFFDDLGPAGHFSHAYVAGALHVTMRLSVAQAETIWRTRASPLCEQFFDTFHPALELS